MISYNNYAAVLLALSLALPAHAQNSQQSSKQQKPAKQKEQPKQENREWNMVKEANSPFTTIRVQQPDGSIIEEKWKIVYRR